MTVSAEQQETTEPDNTNVGLIATVTVVGALLVVSTAAALTALVRTESAAYGTEVGAYANLGTVKRLKAEQTAKLEATPAWADKSKGLVSLPIDRAMELVSGEISKNPNVATPEAPAAAVPATGGSAAPGESPAPAGSAAPTGSAEPASSASGSGSKEATQVPGKEKKDDKKAAHGDAKGPLKIDAPKGAPVAPAGAPAQRH